MIKVCGARAKSTGKPCQMYPCENGRCHLHGGKSTGARTAEGRHRQKMASWKHGYYSKEAILERKRFREMIKSYKEIIRIE